jgi:transcriptional regulator with XRE-family HTH domain
MSLGQTLQELRKAAGLSQTELAERSHTSIDSLRNWEQDRVLPRIDAAAKLARALGVSLDRLVIEDAPSARKKPKR